MIIRDACSYRNGESQLLLCSRMLNDCDPCQHSTSPFIEGWGYIRCPNGYSTLIFYMATVHSDGHSTLLYFTNQTLVKIVQ